jgi:hypothetical protein
MDTTLLRGFRLRQSDLEVDGRLVVDRRVTASAIVERFDVLQDARARRIAADENDTVSKFFAQRREEALGNRVVPAVSLATHTAFGADVA